MNLRQDSAPAEAVQQVLDGLHDIVVPEPVAWTPQTIGWYLLLAAVLALLAWGAVVGYRKRRSNRYRREALAVLSGIEGDLTIPARWATALARVPVLVKRVTLSVVDRSDVASLTGDRWLAFLDTTYGGDGFTHGPGRLLPKLAYGSSEHFEAVTDQQAADLLALVRLWIGAHDVARLTGE